MSATAMHADEATARGYVQSSPIPAMRPPLTMVGPIGWMRNNLFSSPTNIALTIIGALLAWWIIPPIVRFMFIDAVWTGPNREVCLFKDGVEIGACWAFVWDRLAYTLYGSYPVDGRWRCNAFFALGAIAVFWVLHPRAPAKSWAMLYAFVFTPLASYGLLSGNNPLAFLLEPLALFNLLWSRGIGVFANVDLWLRPVAFTLIIFFAGYSISRMQGAEAGSALGTGLVAVVGAALFGWIFAVLWARIGLPPVETARWGGLTVTLVVAAVGIVVSLPIGILLALGRRSKLPIVKFFSVMFIEFVRGVPLITVLFMANTMLPLFLPERYSPDKLLRALVGIALFASAYMAEVVRSGLQALPKGQYEGAMAMGLGYGQMMRLIILPQALKVAIPNIVNTYIGLLKDTSLLLIVGIFDFLKAIENARIDPQWAAPTTSATGYAYAAIVYFIMCYGMARYAQNMEKRLAVADKR
jgi:general L-amino acid transport system permease protein